MCHAPSKRLSLWHCLTHSWAYCQVLTGYLSSYLPFGEFFASLFIALGVYEARQDSIRAHRKLRHKARKHIDSLTKLEEFLRSQGECCSIPNFVSFQEVTLSFCSVHTP